MLISHEVPICMLEKSKSFNDYDYCLLHLTYEYPEYKQFYSDSIKRGRKVLLDNSLFELGDALNNEQLAQGVLDLRPTWYVIPDCLNNYKTTIERLNSFIKDYSDLPGKSIGVIQGATIDELAECYNYMKYKVDKIAIPFGSKAFEEYNIGNTVLEKRTFGRIKFIHYLMDYNMWNSYTPHHLLGCNIPIEFSYYKDIANIETIDTSNPIVNGLLGKKFDLLQKEKPPHKINDMIMEQFNEEQIKLAVNNARAFRRSIDI